MKNKYSSGCSDTVIYPTGDWEVSGSISLVALNEVFEISVSSERRTTGYFLDACHNRLITGPYHVLNFFFNSGL
jgi:hypothetical protein